MSGEEALRKIDEASALEILRQAQTLIAAQIDASKSIDTKATSVLQASLSLAGASLGAAALAMGDKAWLPAWGAAGLLAMAIAFILAAYLAAWTLRVTNIAAPALRPATLIEQGMHEVAAKQAYLFIAFELNKAIEINDARSREAGQRVTRALYASLAAPWAGLTGAASFAAAATPNLLTWLAVLAGAIIVQQLAARVFGSSQR
ncbi:hypothetical protein [Falsiroseomonas selenitidurans]|uniref:Uncharacterized protein n=1 Tax=Falsiroseomonas selenitidurans TaxID=2716335 RepID=A0ABX1EA02_9PROT|nr:hypothetical protein [Falsiroseomonas selenitidurans]NKC33681.1 hypothetical protein [Falsiroseomonas selenitidurans]